MKIITVYKDTEGINDFISHNKNQPKWRVFYTKGLECSCCGLKANSLIFIQEKDGNILIRLGWHQLHGHRKRKIILFNIDHIIPKKKGGTDGLWNTRPCCEKCNNEKGDKTMELEKKTNFSIDFFLNECYNGEFSR